MVWIFGAIGQKEFNFVLPPFLSVYKNQLQPPRPIGKMGLQKYGLDSTESPTSIYTPSSTLPPFIPEIGYRYLGSSPSTGKSPLDMLLSNPIQFIKVSLMSPIYKRNVTEAFGSSMPVSKSKKRATKVRSYLHVVRSLSI